MILLLLKLWWSYLVTTLYPSEDKEQEVFINWFRLTYKNFFIFSVPNGGNRNIYEAGKLKKTGVTAGITDLIILMPNKGIVFLEMKKQKGGVVSKVQKIIFSLIENLGFTVLIGYGFLDAKEKFEQYLKQF